MIKQVKGYKSFWVGSNKIGFTVSYPSGKFINLIVNLDDFTVDEFANHQVGTDLPNVQVDLETGKLTVDDSDTGIKEDSVND